jgi:hypothetical protein
VRELSPFIYNVGKFSDRTPAIVCYVEARSAPLIATTSTFSLSLSHKQGSIGFGKSREWKSHLCDAPTRVRIVVQADGALVSDGDLLR